jgi:crotonobetainyl-CoA:carnitine CoA-transferase CaiB-like acyl-CoA transferase
MSGEALGGIRILDLSWGIAGPLGTLLLAEHGADVIKVEPPGGDPFRSYEGYRCWNRSRRSVTIDLKTPEGTSAFLDLAATADAVVEAFRPGVMDRLGIGFDALHNTNPRLVLLSCPPYPEGHRRSARPGYDALIQASTGQMTDQPGWRMGPTFLHMPMPSMGAMFLVASGLLAGLSARERTGAGQHVRTSLAQGALLFTTQLWQEATEAGAAYHAVMDKAYPPGVHQQMIFECAGNQWLHLSVLSGLTPLKSVDEIIGLTDAPDPLTLMGMDAEQRGAAERRRRDQFRTWDRDALIEALRSNNHSVDPVTPAADVFDHPQTIANGTRATVVDPDVGSTTQMGVPIHLLGTPGRILGPQPRPGADTDDVLNHLPPRTRRDGPQEIEKTTALAGLRVIDFGQYLAGPFGPMVLGDLGADVVKVEPVRGDSMRFAGKPFIGCQRGKRSLALDLKAPAGLDVARRLMAGADIVHHNMTRGVATKLGIDYPAARALRPDVIYCNTYAYGLPDPLGRFGGLDPLYQASAGLEYEAGATHTGNTPLYIRFGMCDTSNAMLSVVGVLLALVHRQRTGEGQELWTSLHDGGIIFSSDTWLGPDHEPWDRPRLDAGLHGLAPGYRIYRTQDESWICVAAVTPAQQAALGDTVGPDLEACFKTKTALQWTRLLDDGGVPNEIVVESRDGAAFLHDDDNVRLGMVTEYDHPLLGRLRQFGSLIDFSATPGVIAGPPPLAGQHSRTILREAGYLDGDIDALVASGVVYETDGEGYGMVV